MFLRWLEHIQREIECRPYSGESSFWYWAKMRYIYNTTGPLCMQRFLRLPANAQDMKTITYLECNYFKDAESLTQKQRRAFDVISHQSNSYFTSAHEILVPVGPGDKSLPPSSTPKRLCVRSASRLDAVSETGHAHLHDQQMCSQEAMTQASSQEYHDAYRNRAALLHQQMCSQLAMTQDADRIQEAMTQAPSQEYHDADRDRAALLEDRAARLEDLAARANELKAFFHSQD